eukprot:GHVT01039329.1.p1 GENE.GHVT01039329.1~~GHVT01039329.1.p1  ORF type:complete len:1189 (+),score=278.88 GHVT01039329.1:1709-5275(+)
MPGRILRLLAPRFFPRRLPPPPWCRLPSPTHRAARPPSTPPQSLQLRQPNRRRQSNQISSNCSYCTSSSSCVPMLTQRGWAQGPPPPPHAGQAQMFADGLTLPLAPAGPPDDGRQKRNSSWDELPNAATTASSTPDTPEGPNYGKRNAQIPNIQLAGLTQRAATLQQLQQQQQVQQQRQVERHDEQRQEERDRQQRQEQQRQQQLAQHQHEQPQQAFPQQQQQQENQQQFQQQLLHHQQVQQQQLQQQLQLQQLFMLLQQAAVRNEMSSIPRAGQPSTVPNSRGPAGGAAIPFGRSPGGLECPDAFARGVTTSPPSSRASPPSGLASRSVSAFVPFQRPPVSATAPDPVVTRGDRSVPPVPVATGVRSQNGPGGAGLGMLVSPHSTPPQLVHAPGYGPPPGAQGDLPIDASKFDPLRLGSLCLSQMPPAALGRLPPPYGNGGCLLPPPGVLLPPPPMAQPPRIDAPPVGLVAGGNRRPSFRHRPTYETDSYSVSSYTVESATDRTPSGSLPAAPVDRAAASLSDQEREWLDVLNSLLQVKAAELHATLQGYADAVTEVCRTFADDPDIARHLVTQLARTHVLQGGNDPLAVVRATIEEKKRKSLLANEMQRLLQPQPDQRVKAEREAADKVAAAASSPYDSSSPFHLRRPSYPSRDPPSAWLPSCATEGMRILGVNIISGPAAAPLPPLGAGTTGAEHTDLAFTWDAEQQPLTLLTPFTWSDSDDEARDGRRRRGGVGRRAPCRPSAATPSALPLARIRRTRRGAAASAAQRLQLIAMQEQTGIYFDRMTGYPLGERKRHHRNAELAGDDENEDDDDIDREGYVEDEPMGDDDDAEGLEMFNGRPFNQTAASRRQASGVSTAASGSRQGGPPTSCFGETTYDEEQEETFLPLLPQLRGPRRWEEVDDDAEAGGKANGRDVRRRRLGSSTAALSESLPLSSLLRRSPRSSRRPLGFPEDLHSDAAVDRQLYELSLFTPLRESATAKRTHLKGLSASRTSNGTFGTARGVTTPSSFSGSEASGARPSAAQARRQRTGFRCRATPSVDATEKLTSSFFKKRSAGGYRRHVRRIDDRDGCMKLMAEGALRALLVDVQKEMLPGDDSACDEKRGQRASQRQSKGGPGECSISPPEDLPRPESAFEEMFLSKWIREFWAAAAIEARRKHGATKLLSAMQLSSADGSSLDTVESC